MAELTDYEKSAITLYTGKSFEKINAYLRGDRAEADFNPVVLAEIKNKIVAIETALSKFEIQDNIILYRQCGEEFLQVLRRARFGLFHEEGFLSTTAVEGSVYRGNVRVEIFTPAGSGAWIKPLSLHAGENEFLINRGAYFKIIDAQREAGYTHIKLSYIGRNTERIIKMGKKKIESLEELDAWLNEGEYKSEEKFYYRPNEIRVVDSQEEYEQIMAQCIKERIWGLSAEEIRTFLRSLREKCLITEKF